MFVVLGRAVFVDFFQTLLGAEAVISVALFDQLARVFEINFSALGLNVRTVIAADVGSFVVVESRFPERTVNNLHRSVHITLEVRVLYAQNEFTAVFTRKKPCVKRGPQAPYMQITRGTGRKSRSYSFHCRTLLSLTKSSGGSIIAFKRADNLFRMT